MNKWYRLGKKFSEKYSDKELYKFLDENNYVNALSCEGKDFREKDYKKMCAMIGLEEETEDKHYTHGERKYYFNWGFDKEKTK